MAGIATYNRKRDFSRTAEPEGKVSAPSRGDPHFVIQKHDASRLHYDFRLEIDGVLCSWAVPKGPSLDPGEKRLAVRTEDHPMAYGGFEGTIPEGEYGGGTVMLWDEGTFKPIGNAREGLKKGDLKFELHGRRLRGSFVLARMRPRPKEKGENWLLIKHRDVEAKPGSGDAVVRENTVSVKTEREMTEIAKGSKTWHSNRAGKKAAPKPKAKPKPVAKIDVARLKGARKARLPQKMAPQLATLIEETPPGSDWLSEIKFDGYRMLARIEDGEVRIFSRNGLPWEKKLPRIARSLGRLKVASAWLDGEIVVLDEDGRSSFSRLKNALGGEQRDIFFFLFDILHLDGFSLMECRQDDRKAVLEQVLGPEPPTWLKYSDHMEGLPDRIRQRACEMHLEGIIVKAADAPYRQQRTRSWLKLKCIQREEFVVVGFTDPQGSREGFGALHLGYYDADGKLHYAGGCGSGFNTKMLNDLHARLEASVRKIPPSILIHGDGPPKRLNWVKPEIVVETQFTEWTDGGSVRHCVFLGVRDDKTPSDVVRDPPTEPIGRFSGAGTVVTAVAAKPKKKTKPKAAKDKPVAPAVIDNRRDDAEGVRLTHPDKLLWPDEKITKADLAAYWMRAGVHALPHIAGRPLALVRCPDGIKGEQFFQKKVSPGFPRQIEDLTIGDEQVIAIRDADGLRALSQMAAIEIHPWGSTVEDIERPTYIVIDLDPDTGLDFEDVIDAAHQVRDALKTAGLASFCKTTGGKGLHVVVPFRPTLEWDDAKAFARSIATAFTRAEPKRFIDVAAKKSRGGRIFIDYLRNGRGATAVAPFSPRARPGATIAMPLTWAQVKPGLDPADYTIESSDRQLAAGAAAWKDFFSTDQVLSAKIRQAFAKL